MKPCKRRDGAFSSTVLGTCELLNKYFLTKINLDFSHNIMPVKVSWTLFQQTTGAIRVIKLAANHSNLLFKFPSHLPIPYSIVMRTLSHIPRTPIIQVCETEAYFLLCSADRRQKYSSICYRYSLVGFWKDHLYSMPDNYEHHGKLCSADILVLCSVTCTHIGSHCSYPALTQLRHFLLGLEDLYIDDS